jgi:hypothetical protein
VLWKGNQNAVAVVEIADAGVVSVPVNALSLEALGFGQKSAAGFELLDEPVEALAGDPGQVSVGEEEDSLGRDRRRLSRQSEIAGCVLPGTA